MTKWFLLMISALSIQALAQVAGTDYRLQTNKCETAPALKGYELVHKGAPKNGMCEFVFRYVGNKPSSVSPKGDLLPGQSPSDLRGAVRTKTLEYLEILSLLSEGGDKSRVDGCLNSLKGDKGAAAGANSAQ